MEIFAGDFDKAADELKLNARKTYDNGEYQVWEIDNADHGRICKFTDKEWHDDWGWWRSAIGSNLGSVNARYIINHHYINAWDGYSRTSGNRLWNRQYNHFLQYFRDELGVSAESNVCAVSVDLAIQNNMTMTELFAKFQGDIKLWNND
jgi:hypothetical protein